MRYLKAFGQFWYDFIIGDDYKIAVSVVLALLAIVAALTFASLSDTMLTVGGAVLLMAAFTLSLLVDIREKS